jgi:DNA-binding transcriptional ArsR family regulator
MPLAIILFLAAYGPVTRREIQENIGRATGTVSFHLTRLLRGGFLVISDVSSEKVYDLADRARVVSLLATFRHLFRDHIDRLADVWLSLRAEPPEDRVDGSS